MRRRRHSVVLRPKVKSLRARQAAAVAALALLALGAAATLSHLRAQLPSWREALAGLKPGVESATVAGVEGPARAEAEAALAALRGLEPGALAAALEERLGWASAVRVRRGWLSKDAVVEVSARRAVARLKGPGREARFLGDDGAVFAAPAVLVPAGLPAVEGAVPSDAERRRLAELVSALAAWEGPPAGLERLRRAAPEGVWTAEFADGTRVLWGEPSWTAEKLARLKAILLDARGQVEGDLTVDLRFFEDGRALLKSAPRQTPSPRRVR